MAYANNEFRFAMNSRVRESQWCAVVRAVSEYVRFAPNQGGDETPRENIRFCFGAIRDRLNRGSSIQQAAGDVERWAYSMEDM